MEEGSLGPFCDNLSIQKPTFTMDLQSVDVSRLKNGHLAEMYMYIRAQKIPWNDIQEVLHVTDCWDQVPRWALPKAFSVVYRRRQQLMKNARDQPLLKKYLDEPAQLAHLCKPVPLKRKLNSEVTSSAEPEQKKASFDKLHDDVVRETTQKLLDDFARIQRTVSEQQKEIEQLKKENARLKKQKTILEFKVTSTCAKRIN